MFRRNGVLSILSYGFCVTELVFGWFGLLRHAQMQLRKHSGRVDQIRDPDQGNCQNLTQRRKDAKYTKRQKTF